MNFFIPPHHSQSGQALKSVWGLNGPGLWLLSLWQTKATILAFALSGIFIYNGSCGLNEPVKLFQNLQHFSLLKLDWTVGLNSLQFILLLVLAAGISMHESCMDHLEGFPIDKQMRTHTQGGRELTAAMLWKLICQRYPRYFTSVLQFHFIWTTGKWCTDVLTF